MTPLICPSCGAQTPRLAGAGAVTCLKCRAPIPAEQLAAPAPVPLPPGHPVAPFAPTFGGSGGGIVATLAGGVVAGGVLGFAASIVEQFYWLVLLFSAALGAGVGFATGTAARGARYRREDGVMFAAVVAGLVAEFVMFYAGYRVVAQQAPVRIDFFQYLDLRCRAGVEIVAWNLGYVGSVVYYLAEGAVVLAVSAGIAASRITEPFCEPCNAWKEKQSLGVFKIDAPAAAAAAATGRPAAMVNPTTSDDRVTIEMYLCPHCRPNGPIEVKVQCTRTEGSRFWTATVFVTYPGSAAAEFEEVRCVCRNSKFELKE